LIYPSGKAPHYPVGYKINAALWVVFALGGPIALFFSIRYPRNKAFIPYNEQETADQLSETVGGTSSDEKLS